MKRFSGLQLCVILSLIVIASDALNACILRVRVSDSPPSYFRDDNGRWSGFVVDQARAILREAGCQAAFLKAPWGRGLRLLENGEIHLMGYMSVTPERETYADFIGPHFHETIKLLVKADTDYRINKHEDLFKLPGKIGIERGAFYGDALVKLATDPRYSHKVDIITSSSSGERTLQQIKQGRISGSLIDTFPGKLKQPHFAGLKTHAFVVNQNPVFFGVSKKAVDRQLLARLAAAVEKLKASGELRQIIEQYD